MDTGFACTPSPSYKMNLSSTLGYEQTSISCCFLAKDLICKKSQSSECFKYACLGPKKCRFVFL